MIAYLAGRLAALVPTLWFVSAIAFLLIRFVPGDPIDAMYGTEQVDPNMRAALRERLGLDQPVPMQYVRWLGRLATGDLGYSYRAQIPVSTLIGQRLPVTLLLVTAGLGLAVALAIPLGILAAVRRDTGVDIGVMVASLVALSVPPFASGIALILLFGLTLGWFPTMGFPSLEAGPLTWLRHLALPAITLAAAVLGIILRLTRATVLEVLGRDFVRTAHAKGLRERAVIFRHVLANALLPVVTLIGLQAGYLLGGAVVVEVVFAWPGIGSLAVDAILGRDYPVVQAVVLLVAAMVVLISLAVDLSCAALDPRVRLA